MRLRLLILCGEFLLNGGSSQESQSRIPQGKPLRRVAYTFVGRSQVSVCILYHNLQLAVTYDSLVARKSFPALRITRMLPESTDPAFIARFWGENDCGAR
jgi:hypothetical protein